MYQGKLAIVVRWLRNADQGFEQMGAHHFVNTNEAGWHKPLEQKLDLIISTSDCDDGFPLKEYMSTLRPLGRFMT